MTAQLLVFATAFSFAIGPGQINYAVVAFNGIAALFFVALTREFLASELLIYVFYISVIGSALSHIQSFRLSTILYLGSFIVSYTAYRRLLRLGALSPLRYMTAARVLIYAYFIVLVIQQVSLALGLPVFNRILIEAENSKLNSLAPEPSLAACILALCMLSYLKVADRYGDTNRSRRLVWICFCYTMVGMRSGLAVVLLAILLGSRSGLRRALGWLVPVALASAVLLSMHFNAIAFERAWSFGLALLNFSPEGLVSADHSASMRVLPLYYYLQAASPFDPNFWLGHGIDYNARFFPNLIPGVEEDIGVGGVIPTFFLNTGMISGIILMTIIKRDCLPRFLSIETLMIALILSTTSINTQLFWFTMLVLTTNKWSAASPKAPTTLMPRAQSSQVEATQTI